jgi:hypothetical protein
MIDQKTNSRGNPAWTPGGPSPNPKGRPRGVRERLGSDIVDSVSKLWAEGGDAVMRRLMVEQPDVFARLAVHIGVPKESVAKIEVSQAIPAGLSPDEWHTLKELLGVIESTAPGAEREKTFEMLERFLRIESARLLPAVEVLPTIPPPVPRPPE